MGQGLGTAKIAQGLLLTAQHPLGQPGPRHLGRHKQPGLSRSQRPCQAGRDRVCSSPQASPAVLGLGAPVALEILKLRSEGAVRTPGMCWVFLLAPHSLSIPCPCLCPWRRAGMRCPLPRASPEDWGTYGGHSSRHWWRSWCYRKGSHGVIMDVQERELLGAPHRQGGLAPPEESVLAFLKCPRVQLLPFIHLTMGLGPVLSHGHSPMDTIHG